MTPQVYGAEYQRDRLQYALEVGRHVTDFYAE